MAQGLKSAATVMTVRIARHWAEVLCTTAKWQGIEQKFIESFTMLR
jgi:hypothetical protein